MKLPHQVSEATRRRNPEIFGSLGGLQDSIRQPDKRSQSQDKQLDEGKKSVGYRITIISLRKKLVDGHDNLRTGAKPLVDAVARTLGFSDDSDKCLEWRYEQVCCKTTGTLVEIERCQ